MSPLLFPAATFSVSRYLIRAAQNEAEFAGMLAHATAHVAERLAGMGPITPVAALPSDNMAFNWGWRPLGWLRAQPAWERQADYLGVRAMAAAGYDPAGLASYLQRVQPSGMHVFATLPDRDERIAAIKKQILGVPSRTYHTTRDFARLQAEVQPLLVKNPPSLLKK